MDVLEEKSATLAKSGSFYYRSLFGEARKEAQFISHLPWQVRIFQQAENASKMVLSGTYLRDNFRVIRFSDADWAVSTTEDALQQRYKMMTLVATSPAYPIPLTPVNSDDLWDYTQGDTIIEANWAQITLNEDILVPSGLLHSVKMELGDNVTPESCYLSLWELQSDNSYKFLGSSMAAVALSATVQWNFSKLEVGTKQLRMTLSASPGKEGQLLEAFTQVDYMGNGTELQDVDGDLIQGAIPKITFIISEGATTIAVNNTPSDLTLNGYTGLTTEYADTAAVEQSVAIFPDPAGSISIPRGTEALFYLRVNPDYLITSISLESGHTLYAGSDFVSEFGLLTFYEHPVKLFPSMKFMAKSYIQRVRNIYDYVLRLDDVYGPVDRVLNYYRGSQSIRSLYLASAQAAGLAVVRKDCRVLKTDTLLDGYTYWTTDGRYDAAYAHTQLTVGSELQAGYVVGGHELYEMYGPEDELPGYITELNLDGVLPVKGLKAPNEVISLISGDPLRYQPAYNGPEDALERYWDFAEAAVPPDQRPVRLVEGEYVATVPDQENAIEHVRSTVCANKLVVACVNEEKMTRDMQLRLYTFIKRELPMGCVLTTATIPTTISQS